MRICHVSPHLPPDQAANALLPAELGSWAHARGDDVRFVTQEPTQGRTAGVALPGRTVRVAGRGQAAVLSRLLRIETIRRARRIIAALDEAASGVDLLHLHSNGLIIEVAAAWAHRRRIPFVLTLYGTEIWHYRRRPIFDPFTRAYRAASAVTFYSRRLMDRAIDLDLGRPGLSVVYPAVHASFVALDETARAALRRQLGIAEPQVVLNVKRLHELAGQTYLIDAFARVARDRGDVRLIICGTGPLRADLEAQAGAAGLAGRVTFTGLVPNDDVARYAAVADVFALPSLLEALPTVAVEALAAGTPVVSADHPGGLELHEIFGDDVAVVPMRDVEGLAAALLRMLAHPRRTMPSTIDHVIERFSPSAVQAGYDAVYDQVLRPARA